jgi:hypothetical protein
MKARFLVAALAAISAGYATSAHAQAFLGDPRLSEGLGIKAGAFELHPGIAGEFGYDSNYFQRSYRPGDLLNRASLDVVPPDKVPPGAPTTDPRYLPEPQVDAYRLRVTPSLSFTTFGRRAGQEGGGPPPDVIFGGRISGSYNALWAADSANSDQVSGQNNIALQGGLNLNVFPVARWGGDAFIDYGRITEASNEIEVSNAFRRDTIRGGVGINWRPGGGLFTWRLGYGITANLFEDSAFKSLDNVQHRIETGGRWKFLPRTSLFYRGTVGWLSYTADDKAKTLGDGVSISSNIGLNGLITNYFGLLVMGGWASSFYEVPAAAVARNYDSFTAQAQLSWYPTPQRKLPDQGQPVGLSEIDLGYVRNFAPSYLGSWYQRDRGYLTGTYFFAQRFVLVLAGGINHITRPESFFATGVEQYAGGAENRVDASAFFEYRPGPSVGINATLRYDALLDNISILTSQGGNVYDDLKFNRYQALVGVRWFL